MLKKVILKTAGMLDEHAPDDADFELWRSIAEYMDGEEALVAESAIGNSEYVFLGLIDKEKDKELHYMMEQDSMIGVYIDDRAGFNEIWESGEYDRECYLYIDGKYLEFPEGSDGEEAAG